MRTACIAALGLAFLIQAGCASPGKAEDFTWSIDGPKTVDKGVEFSLIVKTANQAGAEVPGVPFRFQVQWPDSSSAASRHRGKSGEGFKVHARLTPGRGTILITAENREGLDVKVCETTVEVK